MLDLKKLNAYYIQRVLRRFIGDPKIQYLFSTKTLDILIQGCVKQKDISRQAFITYVIHMAYYICYVTNAFGFTDNWKPKLSVMQLNHLLL